MYGEVRNSMNTRVARKPFLPFLYLLVAIFLLYAVQDFGTSANMGGHANADKPRTGVYVALSGILAALSVYCGLAIAKGHSLPRSRVYLTIWLITIWIAVVNVLQPAVPWTAAVHLGLSVLWILSYHFFWQYLRSFPQAWPQVKFCMGALFALYLGAAVYAIRYFRANDIDVTGLNAVYATLVFLPWIAMAKRKWSRRVGILLVLSIVVVSLKRGAIVVFPAMLAAEALVSASIAKRSLTTAARMAGIAFVFLVCLLVFDYWTNGLLYERFRPDVLADASGRREIYGTAVRQISQRCTWDLVLGLGSGASIQYLGTGTHNEWLEFLFSFGVIGVALYASLLLALGNRLWVLTKCRVEYAPAWAMAATYIAVTGLYGGVYFVHSTFFITAFLGAADGMIANDARKAQPRENAQMQTFRIGGPS